LAKKRRSYDIRPKSSRIRKSWSALSNSGKTYWRSKLDTRTPSDRRTNPLDRIKTSTERARFIKPVYRSPYQRRILEDTGITVTTQHHLDQVEDAKRRKRTYEEKETATLRESKTPYGYKLDEFLAMDHPSDGYTYVTYHLFVIYQHKGINKRTVYTVRGTQYNTAGELADRVEEEVDEVVEIEMENDEEVQYLYTLIQVLPSTGGGPFLPGGVYEKDYEKREKAANRTTHKALIEQERTFLKDFGPNRGN
jgi:hypothetical protein